MLPTELNDNNGKLLRDCVNQYVNTWKLNEGFKIWLDQHCSFVDTLVDRIVVGYPKDSIDALQAELGYEDNLLDQAEPFSLWVIGAPALASRLPLNSSKFNVEFTDSIQAFKEQKVRILNGAHTSMVLGAYLAGLDYVGQCMEDPIIRKSLDQTVFDEIVPTVHLPKEKAVAFAKAVYERFENPFVKHALLAISLNSISKWKARVLPTFKDSLAATGKLPKWLTYSFAAFLASIGRPRPGNIASSARGWAILMKSMMMKTNWPLSKNRPARARLITSRLLWHAVTGGVKTCRLSTVLPMPLRLIWTAWLKSASRPILPN